jgi:hypothetical protein
MMRFTVEPTAMRELYWWHYEVDGAPWCESKDPPTNAKKVRKRFIDIHRRYLQKLADDLATDPHPDLLAGEYRDALRSVLEMP